MFGTVTSYIKDGEIIIAAGALSYHFSGADELDPHAI
jgi:hypothetical protein